MDVVSLGNIPAGRLTVYGLLMLLMWAQPPALQAQQPAIWGTVVDADTGIPLEFASVYLKHSLLGGATNESGEYAIDQIPKGTQILIVSRIGYKPVSIDLEIADEEVVQEIDFRLEPEVYVLEEIAISATQSKKWSRQFALFNKLFLGTMPFEEDAQILNPYSIDFIEKGARFLASSNDVLIIENRGVGYKISFQLMGFEWSKREKILRFTGAGYFEYLDTSSQKDLEIWKANRAIPRGNYSWLARSNPSKEGEWLARVMEGRCNCNVYKFETDESVCSCSYKGLTTPSFLRRIKD